MLKLTKKSDYGLIALRHLALCSDPGTATAKEMAAAYHIPLPILAKVLQKLVRSGLLLSEQGTRGGYRLARDPRRISTLEVIRTIDGPTILTSCFAGHNDCEQSGTCTVRAPLRRVHEGILRMLEGVSISDLLRDGGEPAQGPGRLYGLPDPAAAAGDESLRGYSQ